MRRGGRVIPGVMIIFEDVKLPAGSLVDIVGQDKYTYSCRAPSMPNVFIVGKTVIALEPDDLTIAQSLKEARFEAGLTQEEVGKRVGLGQSHIANWENNVNSPSLANAIEWARALGFRLELVKIEEGAP